ncbi:MAG: hypothetical protein ACNI3A_15400 [Desulfovibrio sp.]|uniref:hypothetical protein n=1 Tax=Desulfovibrio sp. 7SRBS1 TaxID=3378064 RepID=UPI003B3F738B
MQDKFHFAITGKTASEIQYEPLSSQGTINGKCVNRNTRPYFMHSSIPPPSGLNRSNRLPVL